MPIMPEDIAPVAAAPAAAPVAPPTAPVEAEPEIPEEVLAIPAMNGLLQGQPAAVYATEGEKDPAIATVLANMQPLMAAGFNFYRALDGKTNVIFNEQYISAADIQKADKEGKLQEVAVPFSELNESFNQAMGKPPAGAPPGAPAPPMAGGAPAAGLDKKLATARLKNLAVGPPSAGPAPGQGRLLNSIMQPAV